MSVSQLPNGRQQFISGNGQPLVGGTVETYVPGTTTPKTTYQDSAGTIANTNPIVLDSLGSAAIWGNGVYRQVVYDSANNLIWDEITNIPEATTSPVTGLDINYSDSASMTAGVTPARIIQSVQQLRSLSEIGSGQVFVVSYYEQSSTEAVLNPGGGLFQYNSADNTSPDNGGTIIVDAAGNRWYRVYSGIINVQWFGAKGDGVTDDTTAIQNAFNVGSTFIPAATYIVSGLTISNSGEYFGSIGSVIKTNSATKDIITISASNVNLHDLQIGTTITRTAGYSVKFNTSYIEFSELTINDFYIGIGLVGAAQQFRHGRNIHLYHSASNTTQIGIVCSGGSAFQTIDVVDIYGTSQTSGLLAGIEVEDVGDLTLTKVSTVYCHYGLWVTPPTSTVVELLMLSDCLFDTGNGAGVYISPNGGQVNVMKMTQCWVASYTGDGVDITSALGGAIVQVDMINCIIANNTGRGVVINDTGVLNISFIGGQITANGSHGFITSANASRFKIQNSTIGSSGQFAANGGNGIVIGNGSDHFLITGNLVIGNSTGQIVGTPGGTPGTTNLTTNNVTS